MLKNRYDGRKSSLTLYIPNSNQPKVFSKYFNNPPRCKTPIPSDSIRARHNSTCETNTVSYTNSSPIRSRCDSQKDLSQPTLLGSHNRSFTKSSTVFFRIPLDDENRRYSYYGSHCPQTDLYLPEYPPLPVFTTTCLVKKPNSLNDHNEYLDLFANKVKLCKKRCNFENPMADISAKTIKKQTLLELLKVVSCQSSIRQFPKDIIDKTIKMLYLNIERKIKTFDFKATNADDLHSMEDPEMIHLSIVYQMFHHLIRFFPQHPSFGLTMISRLLKQIGSPDPEERVFIQKIILSYYDYHENQYHDIFMVLSDSLIEHREMSTSPFSIGPIIAMMQSIVSSINDIPPSFDKIFVNVVLPMLTSKYQSYFNTSFTNFITVYSSRKQKMSMKILETLIKYWPRTKNEKQAAFLKLLVTIIPFFSQRDLPMCSERIMRIFAETAVSTSQKVANTTFECVTHPLCENLLMDNPKLSFSLLYIPFQTAMNTHWSVQVRDNARQALMFIRRLNTRVFNEVVDQMQHQGSQLYNQDSTTHIWAIIAKQATVNDQSIKLAAILPTISKNFPKPKAVILQSITEPNLSKGSPNICHIKPSKSTPMCQFHQMYNLP